LCGRSCKSSLLSDIWADIWLRRAAAERAKAYGGVLDTPGCFRAYVVNCVVGVIEFGDRGVGIEIWLLYLSV